MSRVRGASGLLGTSRSNSFSISCAIVFRSQDLGDRLNPFRAALGVEEALGVEGRREEGAEKESDMSLKYREMVPAMALTETPRPCPFCEPFSCPRGIDEVVVVVAADSLDVVGAASGDRGGGTSLWLLALRLLAHARMTASLRSSDSAIKK